LPGNIFGCKKGFYFKGADSLEGVDLPLALGNDPDGYALYTPQKGCFSCSSSARERGMTQNQRSCQDTARLLGVDQVHIYCPGLATADSITGLVDSHEDDAFGPQGIQASTSHKARKWLPPSRSSSVASHTSPDFLAVLLTL